MKVLVAAPYTFQGVEVGFCDCEPGELVRLGETDECCCPRYQEDDEEGFDDEVCECRLDRDESSPFLSLVSLAGTTTARVEERGLPESELRAAVLDGIYGAGWLAQGPPDDLAWAFADIEVAKIRQAASRYPVGTLISSLNGLTFRVDEASARAIRRRR